MGHRLWSQIFTTALLLFNAINTLDHKCVEDGVFPAKPCSSEFVVCLYHEASVQKCPAGLIFNARAKQCDFNYNINECSTANDHAAPVEHYVTSSPSVTNAPTTKHNECADLPDGMFSYGCSSDYFACSGGVFHKMQCPSNLVFNEDYTVCDYPYAVKSCDGRSDDEHTTRGHNAPTTHGYKAPSVTTTVAPTVVYGQSSNDVTHNDASSFDCSTRQDGMYPLGCSSQYVTCFFGQSHFVTCPSGLFFNAKRSLCDYDCDHVNEASTTKPVPSSDAPVYSESAPTSAPVYSGKVGNCIGQADGLLAGPSCSRTFVMCHGGVRYEQSCPSGLVFSNELHRCDFPDLCEGSVAEDTTQADVYKKPANDNTNDFSCASRQDGSYSLGCISMYAHCTSQKLSVLNCPAGKVFNEAAGSCQVSCEAPSTTTTAAPSQYQTQPVADDATISNICSKGQRFALGLCKNVFLECRQGRPLTKHCPQQTLFDQKYGLCLYDVPSCRPQAPQPSHPLPVADTPVFAPMSYQKPEVLAQGICQAGMNYARGTCMSSYLFCRDGLKFEQLECPENHRFDPINMDCRIVFLVSSCKEDAEVEEPVFINNAAAEHRHHHDYQEVDMMPLYDNTPRSRHSKDEDSKSESESEEDDDDVKLLDLFGGRRHHVKGGIISNPFYRANRFSKKIRHHHKKHSKKHGKKGSRVGDAFDGDVSPGYLSNTLYGKRHGAKSVVKMSDSFDKKIGRITDSIYRFFPPTKEQYSSHRRSRHDSDSDEDDEFDGSGDWDSSDDEEDHDRRSKRYVDVSSQHEQCQPGNSMRTMAVGFCQPNFILCTEDLQAVVAACPVGEVFDSISKLCSDAVVCGHSAAPPAASPTEKYQKPVVEYTQTEQKSEPEPLNYEEAVNLIKNEYNVVPEDNLHPVHYGSQQETVVPPTDDLLTQSTVAPVQGLQLKPCNGRENGVYSMGCSTSYVTCSNGDAYVMQCPSDLYFDSILHLCNYRGSVAECGGHAVTPQEHQVVVPPTFNNPSVSQTQNPQVHFNGYPEAQNPEVVYTAFPTFNEGRDSQEYVAFPQEQYQQTAFDIPHGQESWTIQEEAATWNYPAHQVYGKPVVVDSTVWNAPAQRPSVEWKYATDAPPVWNSPVQQHSSVGYSSVTQPPVDHTSWVQTTVAPITGNDQSQYQMSTSPSVDNSWMMVSQATTTQSPSVETQTTQATASSDALPLEREDEFDCSVKPDGGLLLNCEGGFVVCADGRINLFQCQKGFNFDVTTQNCLASVSECGSVASAPVDPYENVDVNQDSSVNSGSYYSEPVVEMEPEDVTILATMETVTSVDDSYHPMPSVGSLVHVTSEESQTGHSATSTIAPSDNGDNRYRPLPDLSNVVTSTQKESEIGHDNTVTESSESLSTESTTPQTSDIVVVSPTDVNIAESQSSADVIELIKVLCRLQDGAVGNPCDTSFFICSNGEMRKMECASGQMFRPSTMSCELPHEISGCQTTEAPYANEISEGDKVTVMPVEDKKTDKETGEYKVEETYPSETELSRDTETATKKDDSLPEEIESTTLAAIHNRMPCEYNPEQSTFPLAMCSITYAVCEENGYAKPQNCTPMFLFDHTVYKCVPSDTCGNSQIKELLAVMESGSNSNAKDACKKVPLGEKRAIGDCNRSFAVCGRRASMERCPKDTVFSTKDNGCVDKKNVAACRVVAEPKPSLRSFDSKKPVSKPSAPASPRDTASYCKTKEDGHYRHPESCSRVVQCFNGDMIEYQSCPAGLVFNDRSSSCDYAVNVPECAPARDSSATVSSCQGHDHGAHIAHEEDCSLFYRCVWNGIVEMSCAPGTVFNPSLDVCDWPSNVPNCEDGKWKVPEPSSDDPAVNEDGDDSMEMDKESEKVDEKTDDHKESEDVTPKSEVSTESPSTSTTEEAPSSGPYTR